ncbi:CBS domain-containing protein [Streptomyces canus]|uniref:CBS domain-containing protein n=1 Tax=Streptomyces canus TaxID=58343 RepID=UPI00386A400D
MKATKIGSVMVGDVVTVERDTPFKHVARVLGEHRISGVPVVDEDDKVLGVISETDLMLRQTQDTHARSWLAWSSPPLSTRDLPVLSGSRAYGGPCLRADVGRVRAGMRAEPARGAVRSAGQVRRRAR